MAIQYAFVNNQGEIVHVMSPAYDTMYENGQVVDGLTVIYLSSVEDVGAFMETRYYKNNIWKEKPSKPGPEYTWNYDLEEWSLNISLIYEKLREKRDILLSLTDWTQLLDSSIDESKKQEWSVYRQALRDLPQTYPNLTSISEIIWPEPPSTIKGYIQLIN